MDALFTISVRAADLAAGDRITIGGAEVTVSGTTKCDNGEIFVSAENDYGPAEVGSFSHHGRYQADKEFTLA